MTHATPPSSQAPIPSDLSRIPSRLDDWMTTLEQGVHAQPVQMPDLVRHLQTIADQTRRTADILTELTDPRTQITALAERVKQLEMQNAALLTGVDQVLARVDLLCDWFGAMPLQAAAQT